MQMLTKLQSSHIDLRKFCAFYQKYCKTQNRKDFTTWSVVADGMTAYKRICSSNELASAPYITADDCACIQAMLEVALKK